MLKLNCSKWPVSTLYEYIYFQRRPSYSKIIDDRPSTVSLPPPFHDDVRASATILVFIQMSSPFWPIVLQAVLSETNRMSSLWLTKYGATTPYKETLYLFIWRKVDLRGRIPWLSSKIFTTSIGHISRFCVNSLSVRDCRGRSQRLDIYPGWDRCFTVIRYALSDMADWSRRRSSCFPFRESGTGFGKTGRWWELEAGLRVLRGQ